MNYRLRFSPRRCAALVVLAAAQFWLGQAAAADAGPRDRAAVVFIGHSLINYEMPRIVQLFAESLGLTMHRAVQIAIGTPLAENVRICESANFSGQWPPEQFACDEIQRGSPIGPYDTLIATDANNSIESNRLYWQTDRVLEGLMQRMHARNPAARTFMFTAWEEWGSPHHGSGSWLNAIAGELGQYETIVASANSLSVSRGRPASAAVLPANVALRELFLRIEQGAIPGVTNRTQIFATGDNVHMSELGNYFIASVVFATIFNRSAEGAITRIPGRYSGVFVDVPQNTATALHRLAWSVVSQYRGAPPPSEVRPRAPAGLAVQ